MRNDASRPSHAPAPRRRGMAHRLGVSALATAALAAAALSAPPATGSAISHDVALVKGKRQMTAPFRVATFNILGASHTESPKRGFDTYKPRMRKTIRLINRRGFSIVGLQEYQIPQHEMFLRRTNGSWKVWPGLKRGRRPVQNSITWRAADWRLVDKGLYKIPYFRGKMIEQPYVKLKHKRHGAAVWVMNTHNVSNSKGPAQRWRNEAIDIEARLANRLGKTGVPVIFTGDFNDRERAFCRLTSQTSLKAVNGGGWRNGRCNPPSRMRIDWIFVSRKVNASGYTDLDTRMVRRITDHKVIYADLSVPR